MNKKTVAGVLFYESRHFFIHSFTVKIALEFIGVGKINIFQIFLIVPVGTDFPAQSQPAIFYFLIFYPINTTYFNHKHNPTNLII